MNDDLPLERFTISDPARDRLYVSLANLMAVLTLVVFAAAIPLVIWLWKVAL